MQDLTAHQRPDGMYLVPDNPYSHPNQDAFPHFKDWELANPPIPTDDKDLVEGQKVNK